MQSLSDSFLLQILFTSVETEYTVLFGSLRFVKAPSLLQVRQETSMQDVGCVENIAQSKEGGLHHLRMKKNGAWHLAGSNVEATLMQATMLEVFQAHRNVRHKSKISVMVCEVEMHKAGALQTEHVQMPHYLYDARVSCQSMLINMHKTVHKEYRDACGPAVRLWSSYQEPKMQVRRGHACGS